MEWEAGDALCRRAVRRRCILPAALSALPSLMICAYHARHAHEPNHFFRLAQATGPVCQLGFAIFSDLRDDLRCLGYQHPAGGGVRAWGDDDVAFIVDDFLGNRVSDDVAGDALGEETGCRAGRQRLRRDRPVVCLSG